MALTLKSIDTMKISRDSASITNAQKIEHINSIVLQIPDVTHIAIACYADNFGYQSVAYIKEWFDAVHNAGKAVLFRPAWGSPGADAAAIKTSIVEAAADLVTCWQDGDWWDVFPESNPSAGAFTNVAGWNTFVRDTMTELQTYFSGVDLDVNTDLWSVTDTHVISNDHVEAETVTAAGNKVCIDFYPMDAGATVGIKVQSLIGQIKTMHANYPTADIYITETGYNNTSAVTDVDQKNVIELMCKRLANECPYVKGLNYWCGYGDAAFDKTHVWQSQSRVNPRAAVRTLMEYYKFDQLPRRKFIY